MTELDRVAKPSMRFWSAVSLETEPDAVAADLRDQLGQPAAALDLLVAFVRPPDGSSAETIMRGIRTGLPASHFFACTAESVVGGGREIEDQPAVVALAATLPDVQIDPLPDFSAVAEAESATDPGSETSSPIEAVIALVDPFSVPVDRFLAQLDAAAPGVPVIGGLASWGSAAGQNRLAQNDVISDRGAVGVMLRGNLTASVVVSQGCRPVGPTYTVTGSRDNFITGLDGMPPIQVLRDTFQQADEETQTLMRSGVLIGRAATNDPERLGRGAYLIRGVFGAQAQSGAIAVGDSFAKDDFVQFHVRDADTAQEDLELLLTPQVFEAPAAGALMFTCNARGSRMYGHPDGDISIVQRSLGDSVPVAGFFCAGELGPIGEANHVHGFTASMAIFRSKE